MGILNIQTGNRVQSNEGSPSVMLKTRELTERADRNNNLLTGNTQTAHSRQARGTERESVAIEVKVGPIYSVLCILTPDLVLQIICSVKRRQARKGFE